MIFVNLKHKIDANLVIERSPSVKGVFDLLKKQLKLIKFERIDHMLNLKEFHFVNHLHVF